MQQQELLKKIFQIAPSEEVGSAMLDKIVADHPYFGLSHFFHLTKTEKDDATYKKILGRLSLHFNNPYLLNIRLNGAPSMETAKVVDTGETKKSDETLNDTNPDSLPEPEVHKSQPDSEEESLFEPLHTTDYFASQGIKISEEQQSSDKLGKQLKSFTEWLKTMKKVHGNTLPETPESIDDAVQKLAENSNRETEVNTEAMAEVYIRQGKQKKAIEIYEKLSLQNPSKKVYFAEKIELLKEK